MAGLDPRQYPSDSNASKKPHLSKTGNRYLRIALYMPALSAARHDPNGQGLLPPILSAPAASRSSRLSARSCANSCSPSMLCLERILPSTAAASSHPLKRPL